MEREILYCKCGHPIDVIHNSNHTCRTDGKRFVDMKREDHGWCLFRCPACVEVVEYDKLEPDYIRNLPF